MYNTSIRISIRIPVSRISIHIHIRIISSHRIIISIRVYSFPNSVYAMGFSRVIRLVMVLLLTRARADKLNRWCYSVRNKSCCRCSAVEGGGTTALQPQQHCFSNML